MHLFIYLCIDYLTIYRFAYSSFMWILFPAKSTGSGAPDFTRRPVVLARGPQMRIACWSATTSMPGRTRVSRGGLRPLLAPKKNGQVLDMTWVFCNPKRWKKGKVNGYKVNGYISGSCYNFSTSMAFWCWQLGESSEVDVTIDYNDWSWS